MRCRPKPGITSRTGLPRDLKPLTFPVADFAPDLWLAHKARGFERLPEACRALADRLLDLGEPLLALDVAAEGTRTWPEDTELPILAARALLDARATAEAWKILTGLDERVGRNARLGYMLGRAREQLAEMLSGSDEKKQGLAEAMAFYAAAFEQGNDYCSGLGAARLACVLGREREAVDLAGRVRGICLERLEKTGYYGDGPLGVHVALAETALIRRQWDEALTRYEVLGKNTADSPDKAASARRRALLLAEATGADESMARSFEKCFRIPNVVVFSGHLIDRPERSEPRFPSSWEDAVGEKIRSTLARLDGRIGFASAAAGADILFLEAILEIGGEIHVVLPFDRERFLKSSVAFLPGSDWASRFHRILDRAGEVTVLPAGFCSEDEAAYEFTNVLLLEKAGVCAKNLETELKPLAVWDGRPGDGPGGTAGAISLWRRAGLEVETISPGRKDDLALPAGGVDGRPVTAGVEVDLKAIFLVEIPKGGRNRLLHEVMDRLVVGSDPRPLAMESWPGGKCLIWVDAPTACGFALDLAELLNQQAPGGENPAARIILHAADIPEFTNPLTGLSGYSVVQAALAFPFHLLVPAGAVYASREFVFLSACGHTAAFICEYAGRFPLAGRDGFAPLYHVRRLPGNKGR